jgi:hypothetical protein
MPNPEICLITKYFGRFSGYLILYFLNHFCCGKGIWFLRIFSGNILKRFKSFKFYWNFFDGPGCLQFWCTFYEHLKKMYSEFFFDCTEDWTWLLALARQALYHLIHVPILLLLVHFSDRVSHFCLRLVLNHDPSMSVSWVAGITCHHPWLWIFFDALFYKCKLVWVSW